MKAAHKAFQWVMYLYLTRKRGNKSKKGKHGKKC